MTQLRWDEQFRLPCSKRCLSFAHGGSCCHTQAFSSCGEQGRLSVAGHRLLTAVASTVECGLQAQLLCKTGSDAPPYGGYSQNKDPTGVPCIVRWILYHWTTSQALVSAFFYIVTKFLIPPISSRTRSQKDIDRRWRQRILWIHRSPHIKTLSPDSQYHLNVQIQ